MIEKVASGGGSRNAGSPLLGLRWRIKDSFVSYVLGRAGGRYALADGAELLADRYFGFPCADGAEHTAPRFAGAVAFSAHGGMLHVALCDLALRTTGDLLELTANVDGEPAAIATLDRTATAGTWIGAVPRLTEAGRALFGGVYEVGEGLDPLYAWQGD